ncbi:MAG: hypothetical protein K6G48_02785 [Acholeplasmatales bacterium]|nr:hypothetical protein [Acholeplasmatales bacterium]
MQGKGVLTIALMYYKKNRRKYLRISISLTLAFVMLICISFLAISFDLSYKAKMNEEETLLSCQVRCNDSGLLKEVDSLISNDENIAQSIEYDLSYYSYYHKKEYKSAMAPTIYYYPEIEIDGISYDYSLMCEDNDKKSDVFNFFNLESNLILDSEYDYANKNDVALLYGDCNVILDNSVYLSSDFCDYYNLDYNSIIGKTINYRTYLSSDEAITLIDNFTVIGVFNTCLYDIPTRNIVAPILWLPASAYEDINSVADDESYTMNLIQFNDFSGFKSSIKAYNNLANEDYNVYVSMPDLSMYYIKIYPLLTISEYILYTLSIFILVIAILNLFHVVAYIFEKELKFLGMCRAIGLEKRDRRRFTLTQNTLILAPPILISCTISLIACIILTKIFNNNITIQGIFSNTVIFNMKYFAITLLIFIVLVILLIEVLSLLVIKYLKRFNNNSRINL